MLFGDLTWGKFGQTQGGAVRLFEDRDESEVAAGWGRAASGVLRGLRPEALRRPRREDEVVDLWLHPSLLLGQSQKGEAV